MLYLVGMGLCDEKDLSVRAVETLKRCDKVYIELYTNPVSHDLVERLERLIGRDVEVLERNDIEDDEKMLSRFKEAVDREIALVVPGDPLIATTHTSLIRSAVDRGIRYRVIHGSSVISAAIGESGLHVYKFGPPVTIPRWYDNYTPLSPYDKVYENRSRGLHTILLIDIVHENGNRANLPIRDVLSILYRMEEVRGKGLFTPSSSVVVLSRLGCKDQRIVYAPLNWFEDRTVPSPFVMIVPGDLHFTEKEWLDMFKP